MLARLAVCLSIVAGLSAQSLRLVNEDPKFITSFSAASGRAVYTSAAHGFANNDQVFCLIPSGRGLLGDSYRSPTAFNVRTVTAVTTNTFELLDEASSAVLDVSNQTAIALDTKEASPRYGFCARFGTYSYRAGEVGGLIPIAGSQAMTNLTNAATGSPSRYASFITHVNAWSTSGCDGATSGACTVEESKIVATTVQNTSGDDLTFGYVPLNMALACQITGTARYCESAEYYIKNVHRWLSGGQFAGCDQGVGLCGRGSMADWSAFGNKNTVQAYRTILSRLSAGEKTDFLNRMTTNAGDSCTSQMGAVVARGTGTTTTITLDTSAAAAGIAAGDIVYLNDRRNRFQASDSTLQSLVVASGVATLTTSTAHSLVTNYHIQITGTPGAALDGKFKITGTSAISGVLRVATFATGAADGTYTTGATVQILRDFNTNQQGLYVRVTSVSGNDIVVNQSITSYSTAGGITSRSAADAEIQEVATWTTGNCGAIWFDGVHGYNPAPMVGAARVRFAGAASTSDTVLPMTAAEIYRIQASAGWAYLAGADQRYEVVRIDSVNYSNGQVTVTRGQFGTETNSYTTADYMYVGRFPFASTGTTVAWGDIWSNLTLTKTANSFVTSMMLGYEDAEMRALAEKNWFYFRAGQWPIYREHFSGMTLGGSTHGYDLGRYTDFIAELMVSLTNTLSTEPTLGDDIFKGKPLDTMYRLLPGNVVGKKTYTHMAFSDGGISRSLENDDFGGLVMLIFRNPSWDGVGQFWTLYDDVVKANLGTSHENYINFFPYSTEAGITAAKAAFSLRDPWRFYDASLKSASATDPNKLFGAFASRSSWTDAADGVFATFPDSPQDHLSQYHPSLNWSLARSSVELMVPSNRGVRLGNVALYANGILCIGATSSNNGCGMRAPSAFGVSDVVLRATHGSTDTRYVAIGCKDTFDAAQGVTTCEGKLYHLITSDGKTHIVDYRRLQTSAAKQVWYQNVYYRGYSASGAESQQSPAASTVRSGNLITYRSPQFNHSALSTIVVQPVGSVYEDTAATFASDPFWGDRMRTVLGSGTDFEHLTTHMSVSNTSDVQPAVNLLTSDSGLRVIEIADGTVTWVLSMIRGVTAVTTQNFTSTHSGTGRYAVSGLQANANYRVDRGGVTLYASLAAGSGGLIRFDGSSGTYAITQTGAPPNITITTSSPLTTGTQNTAYSTNIVSINGTGGHTWSVSSGTLPAGLTLTGTTGTATLSGTPSNSGTFNFTAQVTDSLGSVATKDFALTVNASVSILLSAAPSTLNYAYTVGGADPPSQTFDATCANGSCSSTATTDQSWCTVSPSSGSTPRTYTVSVVGAGLQVGNQACTVTVAAAEAANTPVFVGVNVTVTAPSAGPSISHNGATTLTVGASPTFDLSVTGGTGPYVFTVEGGTPLPPGITGINASTGALEGTLSALGQGDFPVTFRVTDTSDDRTDDVGVVFTTVPSTGLDSLTLVSADGDALLVLRRAAGIDATTACEFLVRRVSTGNAVSSGTLTDRAAVRFLPVTGLTVGTYAAYAQCGSNGATSAQFTLGVVAGTLSLTLRVGQPTGASGGNVEYGATSALGSSTALSCSAGACSATLTGLSDGRIGYYRIVWTGGNVPTSSPSPILVR